MGEYLFCDARYDAEGNKTDFALNDARFEECGAMVVGSNFGCGSSREHAPQAVKLRHQVLGTKLRRDLRR